MIKSSRFRSTLRRKRLIDQPSKEQVWKKYAKLIIPHIGLCFISFVYIVGGAFIFYLVESPNEQRIRKYELSKISMHQNQMLNHLWKIVNDETMSKHQVELIASSYIENSTKLLFEAFDTHYISASHLQPNRTDVDDSWTLTTAIFFTTTLLTTIGYGNQAPVTPHGRLICIFYALLGVPLILITVADLGKFLSENIIWLYTLYADRRKKDRDATSNEMEDEVDQEKKELAQLGLEHYITIPIMLIATILLGYMMLGALLLSRFEKWTFFEGFYFSFITMTTVGFGDIVPLKQQFFLFDLFYIIVGLAITTMCIDLAGLQYIRKIHYFGRAIKDARYALVNVGGRMIHVGDVLKYANVLQQKYGQKKTAGFAKGPYTPNDLALIRFIDYSSVGSLNSLTSYISSIFTKSTEPSLV